MIAVRLYGIFFLSGGHDPREVNHMKVREIMTPRPVAVGSGEPVTAAARLLSRYNLGALPVCDGAGRLRGMVTDRDIVVRCMALENDPAATRVSEIMSRGVAAVAPETEVSEAVRTMSRSQVRRLPVTEGGRLVGMVTLCDLARREDCRMECAQAMEAVSANLTRR